MSTISALDELLAQQHEEWRRFGEAQLAQAYGPDEPEYTEADIEPQGQPSS